MTTLLSAGSAINLLESNPAAYATQDALRALVDKVSVEASGAVTIFYGGGNAGDIVSGLVDQGADIRVLDNTQAFEFLKSLEFRSAVANIFEITVEELGSRNSIDEKVISANNWLNSLLKNSHSFNGAR